MFLKDWICYSRGGKTLNRSVGSLFTVKDRKAKYTVQVLVIGKV